MNKDYRKNQKVIATFVLEDKGQDFTEIDVLENGVILGNSIMFENGRLSTIGVGTLDGKEYWTFSEMRSAGIRQSFNGFYIYLKNTNKQEPLPWETTTIDYKIIDVKKAKKPNRFLTKLLVK